MVDKSPFKPQKKQTFGQFLWNSETKQFLGRTGLSWLKITVFYVIFYACLAVFFAGMMMLFYQTLDTEHMPKYTPGYGGSILRNPALSIRPLPRFEDIESTLIQYRDGDEYDIRHWTESLNEFIRPYEGYNVLSGQHLVDCHEDRIKGDDEVCRFEDVWLADKCTKAESWGYNRGSPCIILKLNRMINWEPEVFESVDELPQYIPQSLKEHIHRRTEDNNGVTPKMIWVSCEGETAADNENMGPLEYSPWQGFPAYYFPFRNTPGYLSPLVAVQFSRPQHNVLIRVECRAWAYNIIHDRQRRLGLVNFELLID